MSLDLFRRQCLCDGMSKKLAPRVTPSGRQHGIFGTD
jgi:hypothetical protein